MLLEVYEISVTIMELVVQTPSTVLIALAKSIIQIALLKWWLLSHIRVYGYDYLEWKVICCWFIQSCHIISNNFGASEFWKSYSHFSRFQLANFGDPLEELQLRLCLYGIKGYIREAAKTQNYNFFWCVCFKDYFLMLLVRYEPTQ